MVRTLIGKSIFPIDKDVGRDAVVSISCMVNLFNNREFHDPKATLTFSKKNVA